MDHEEKPKKKYHKHTFARTKHPGYWKEDRPLIRIRGGVKMSLDNLKKSHQSYADVIWMLIKFYEDNKKS